MIGTRTGRTNYPRIITADPSQTKYMRARMMDAAVSYDGKQTYPQEFRAGLPIGIITANGKATPCKRTSANGQGIGATSLVGINATTLKAGDTLTIKGKRGIVKATHSATAASTGLALYLHIDELGESPFGHLESVTAGNADSSFTTIDGAVVKVEDDDAAATLGVAVYFDEDATNPDERLLAAVPTLKDAFILASDGRAIRIKYNATPATPGVLVYFDDDGATDARMLFVSPTTANGLIVTDDLVGNVEQDNKITRDTGNVIVSIVYSTSTITLTDAATWCHGDEVFADGTAGAGSETCVGILDEFVDLVSADDRVARDESISTIMVVGEVTDSMLLGDMVAIKADIASAANLKQIRFV